MPKPTELDDLLLTSLADGRLSRHERRSLRDHFEEGELDTTRVQRIRSEAFATARSAAEAGTTSAADAFDWLEDVLGVLDAVRNRRNAPGAVRAEAWFSPGEGPRDRIIRLIDDARARLDICVFTITDNGIARAIVRAHERGIRIRIVTDNDKAWDRGSDVEDLSEAGIPLVVDKTEAHMHHKFMVVDGALLLNGSYNWTRSAYRENEENVMLTSNPKLVATYQEQFDALWSALKG